MGIDNVIYLSELSVPSYRRGRKAASGVSAATVVAGAWRNMARERATSRHTEQAAGTQRELTLVSPSAGQPLPRPGPEAIGIACGPHHPLDEDGGPTLAGEVRMGPAGTGFARASDGRLRLSGRLIDVCAELERLAAAEAGAALPRRA